MNDGRNRYSHDQRLPVYLALLLLCASAGPTGCAEPQVVGDECSPECDPGSHCVDRVCRVLCSANRQCRTTEYCGEDGYCIEPGACTADATTCCSDTDCTPAPPCYLSNGTCEHQSCVFTPHVGGECDDQNACTVNDACTAQAECGGTAVDCQQSPPYQVCVELTGSCVVAGDCQGTGCCVFDPVWPEDSISTQPACPFASEDADGDGVEDAEETWSGVCTHGGQCGGCTDSTQCDDDFECTTDTCDTANVCQNTPVADGACDAGGGPASGRCVVVGPAAECLLEVAEPCTSDDQCADGFCECADDNCTSRICHESGCPPCTWTADGLGACTATAVGNDGEDCTDATTACSAASVCLSADGEECTSAGNCASGNCECTDADCSLPKVCSEVACLCGYNAEGDDTCDGHVPLGSDDGPDRCGSFACNGNGACQVGQGEDCSGDDADCSTGFCSDYVCCLTACDGNCDRCDMAGAEGTCTADTTQCVGNCDDCAGTPAAYSCNPNPGLCSGSCASCVGSGTNYSCTGDVSLCLGNCDTCSGSGSSYNCAPDNSLCTGNCDECAGGGNTYNCAGNNANCAGNCGACAGSDTEFNCQANNADCVGNCDFCQQSGSTFNCAPNANLCTGDCDECNQQGAANNFSCDPVASVCDSYSCGTCAGSDTDYSCTAVSDGTAGDPSCGAYLCDGANMGCPSSCGSTADCTGSNLCCTGVCDTVTEVACGSATDLGSLDMGSGTLSGAVHSMSTTSQANWYRVNFPPNYDHDYHGTGIPTVEFARNDNTAFRLRVFPGSCPGTPSGTALTSWTRRDNASASGAGGSYTTRNVAWPDAYYIEVTKVANSGTCERYQVQARRPAP